jgi:RimJ/RimL family protein N-acetyltransferase
MATERLALEPLRVDHAGEMVEVLADRRLHEYVGGTPPSRAELERRYALQVVGHSPDQRNGWLNWIVRERETGAPVGTVQATLAAVDGGLQAEVAWVIGTAHQRRGYAKEAAAAMVDWLTDRGVDTITAHIHPNHEASMGVARYLGLSATDVIEGGETRWQSPRNPDPGPLARSNS